MTKKIKMTSLISSIKFYEESIEEHVAFYDADNTHSCIYLFNPKKPMEIDIGFTLINVTQITTSMYT